MQLQDMLSIYQAGMNPLSEGQHWCHALRPTRQAAALVTDTDKVVHRQYPQLHAFFPSSDCTAWDGRAVGHLLARQLATATQGMCGALQVISTLRGHDDKVRVVLNKSDQVDMQQLMRVYGALMWSLGKVFKSPEVPVPHFGLILSQHQGQAALSMLPSVMHLQLSCCAQQPCKCMLLALCLLLQKAKSVGASCGNRQVCKVYLGSFNADKPIRADLNPAGIELFAKEQGDLLNDLYEIPQRSCDRKACPIC